MYILLLDLCFFRLIKEFDKEVKALEASFDRETNKMLNEKKQAMVRCLALDAYVDILNFATASCFRFIYWSP